MAKKREPNGLNCQGCGTGLTGRQTKWCSRKCMMKEWMQEYSQRPKRKAIRQEYEQRPEVKAYRQEYWKEYGKRPERRAKRKERYDRLGGDGHRREFQALRARDGDLCRWCFQPIDFALEFPHPQSATVDHWQPQSKGGTNDITNLCLMHNACNSSKKDRWDGSKAPFPDRPQLDLFDDQD